MASAILHWGSSPSLQLSSSSSAFCAGWSRSTTIRKSANPPGIFSPLIFRSSLRSSPFLWRFQARHVRILRGIAPCRSQSDPSENFTGRHQPAPVNWQGGFWSNARASKSAGGILVGTAASVTNKTVGEREDGATISTPVVEQQTTTQRILQLAGWKPPRYLWRSVACLIIAGQVIMRVIQGKVHKRNTIQQLESVGPKSLGVSLLTASFVGMVFTIQFVREFARLGLTRSVGGVLALALARELSPVVTAIILAGRVGSAFAAELGTMQVSEQTDTLRVLRTDPVDYLITPRVIACCISLPILTIICFTVGMAASVLLADSVYNVSSNIILESAARALQPWDLISTSMKSTVFGGIISIISCAWGVTTSGGAKGVGESTTSAVVISLVCIFIADFILSWLFFQGAGDALKAAMG